MNTNKIVIYVTIIACVLIIGVPAFFKIVKINEQKLNLVNEKKVCEAAYKCYYENKCPTNVVTLKELYENGYLVSEIVNPSTGEIISNSSYVEIYTDQIKFYPI